MILEKIKPKPKPKPSRARKLGKFRCSDQLEELSKEEILRAIKENTNGRYSLIYDLKPLAAALFCKPYWLEMLVMNDEELMDELRSFFRSNMDEIAIRRIDLMNNSTSDKVISDLLAEEQERIQLATWKKQTFRDNEKLCILLEEKPINYDKLIQTAGDEVVNGRLSHRQNKKFTDFIQSTNEARKILAETTTLIKYTQSSDNSLKDRITQVSEGIAREKLEEILNIIKLPDSDIKVDDLLNGVFQEQIDQNFKKSWISGDEPQGYFNEGAGEIISNKTRVP